MTVNKAFLAVILRNILAHNHGESNAWHGEFVDVKISFALTDRCVSQTEIRGNGQLGPRPR
jgi:hypothetical protein